MMEDMKVFKIQEWVPNKGAGGRYRTLHVASIGLVDCRGKTVKAAKDGLIRGLAKWHAAGHGNPTFITVGNVTGILWKAPLVTFDAEDDVEIEWLYQIAGRRCVTISGGTFEDVKASLERHVANLAEGS